MDIKGKIIIPAFYYQLQYLDGFLIAKDNENKYTLFLKTGEIFLPGGKVIRINIDDKIEDAPFVLITTFGKWFVMSRQGKILVPEDYYTAVAIEGKTDDWYIRIVKNGYQAAIDNNGKVIIPLNKYNLIERFGDKKSGITYSFVIYGNNKGSGVCDQNGKELIRSKAAFTYKTSNGFVGTFGGSGISLDKNGVPERNPKGSKNAISQIYVNGKSYNMLLTPEGYRGIMNNGKLIVPTEFDAIAPGKKYFMVTKGFLMGAYDTSGNCIIPPKYTSIGEMGNYFSVSNGYKYTAVSLKGKEYAPFDALITNLMINGKDTFIVKKSVDDAKWGIFTKNNEMIVPCRYSDLGFLKDNETAETVGFCVFENRKIGVCDKKGKEIIPPLYQGILVIGQNNNKIIRVKNGRKYGAYKMDGTMIVSAEIFDDITYSNNKLIATSVDRKCTFDLNGKLLSDTRPDKERDNYIKMADEEFNKDNWSKAANYYGKAIERSASATLYYNRAVSYYNNKKYNKAIDDFNKCLSLEPSQNLIDKSKSLIAKARQLQAEKIERRNARISNIFGLVVGVAAVAANAYVQSQNSSQQRKSYTSTTTQSNILLDPNLAMLQVQQQNWRDYMTETNGGKTMSYDDWFALKSQATAGYNNSDSGGSSSYSSSSANNSSNRSVYASDCRMCYGTGNCRTCDGRGYYYNPLNLSKTVTCPNCPNHNGKCSSCGGSGKKL